MLLTAPFLASTDATIANVATPAIRTGLGASGAAAQFVVGGYLVAYAVLLITGARLGQTHGYRRLFVLGIVVFGTTSLACGLAPDVTVLVVMRIAQGAGAALMFPQALTGIQLQFVGERRTRAIGLFAAALSLGAVFGQVLGGILVSADVAGATWRPIFLVNVPICLAVTVVARRVLPADDHRDRVGVDLIGVAMLSVSVALVVVPLTLGPDQHWPAWSWAALAASLPSFALFVRTERRLAASGGAPLVDTALVTRPAVAWGLVALLTSTGPYFALLFVVAQYVQTGLGHSALFSGLILVPWVAAFGVAGQVVRRLPVRWAPFLPATGYVLMVLAYLAISAAGFAGALSEALLGTLFAGGGFGLGMGFTTMLGHLANATPSRLAPDLSGVATTTTQLGGSIGVAGFGSLYLAQATAHPPGHAFAVTALALAATALVAALAASRATGLPGPVATGPGGVEPLVDAVA